MSSFAEKGEIPFEITRNKEVDLSGQVAIVTGASRGIGRAIAEGLGRCGASVVITSRPTSEKGAQDVLSKINSFGAKGLWIPGDMTNPQTPKTIMDRTISQFGRLDILVNNAGQRHDGLFVKSTDEEFMQVLSLNLISPVSITKKAVIQMIKQHPPGGNIIFIGSLAAEGSPGQSFYAASKAGLEGFAKSIALEYASRNIRVNVVSPGLVDTEMTRDLDAENRRKILDLAGMKQSLKPENVAEAVLGLLLRESSANGTVIKVR